MRSWMTRLLLLLAFVVGCAHPSGPLPPHTPSTPPPTPTPPVTPPKAPGPPVSTPQSRALWSLAARAGARGDRLERTRHLRRLVRDQAGTPEGVRAALALGDDALARRAYGQITRGLGQLKTQGTQEFRRLTLLASAYEGLEHFERAARLWLRALPLGEAKPRADASARQGAARALFLAGRTQLAQATLRDATGTALKQLVKPKLTTGVLERLYGKLETSDPWRAWLALQLARARCAKADLAGCRKAALQAAAKGKDPLVRREAQVVLDEIAKWDKVVPQRVGVLLPLTGPYGRIGKAALQAIQLAAAASPQLKLEVRDTQGDAAVAARLAKALILDHHVSVILGPVGVKETEATAKVSARYGIPHVHLSATATAARRRPTVFRARMSQAEQGEVIARYGTDVLGLKRFAILYPNHAAGRQAMAGFWDTVVARGGV